MVLLDTGATDNFIDHTTITKLWLGTKRVAPQLVQNMDGTYNQHGTITQAVDLLISQGNRKE